MEHNKGPKTLTGPYSKIQVLILIDNLRQLDCLQTFQVNYEWKGNENDFYAFQDIKCQQNEILGIVHKYRI